MRRLILAAMFVHTVTTAAAAQSEGDLKRYFEGRKVTVSLDMPATKDGVNVYPQRPQPLDFSDYARRLKQFGIAVEEGDRLMITRIRVKESHIEFQLGGGGYGTFGDETEPVVVSGHVSKSSREKRLENEIRKEANEDRRRRLRNELDELRRERHRDERRLEAESEIATELGKQRIEKRRLQGGSRFNIRFDTMPAENELTPETVIKALSEYVEF
jgi:hypothetical protein